MFVTRPKFLTIQNMIWIIAISLLIPLIFLRVSGSVNTLVVPPAVIGYSNSPSWWPWIIVDSQDLLQTKQINAELKWYDNYSNSVGDFNSGYIDGNSQEVVDVLATEPKAVKGKVAALLNSYSAGEDKLIVRDGIGKVEDLKGKKIIAESATKSNHLLSLILATRESSIVINDLEVLNLEAGSASAAFAVNEEIDGVVTLPPYTTIALKRKDSHELISSNEFPEEIARMLVVTKDIFDNRPELVEQLIGVWFQAIDFIQEHPEEANNIIAQRIGIEADRVQIFQDQIQIVQREQATASKVLAQLHQSP